jgi:hypothetical protein
MPKADRLPQPLRPFRSLGVDFTDVREDEAFAQCPFCGRDDGKFSVNVLTSQYFCFVCGAKGNSADFVKQILDQGTCSAEDAAELAESRGLLNSDTLIKWGVVKSPVTGEWLWTEYSPDGKPVSAGRYEYHGPAGKRVLKGVEELEIGLFGVQLYDPNKPALFICEAWNAPVLWELLRSAGLGSDGNYELTGVVESSLAKDANVLGVPGANVWKEKWCKLAAGKKVVLMVDSDHPIPHPKQDGVMIEGAGVTGARRAAQLMALSTEPPESIHWLKWGEGGFDPAEPSGYDLRDFLTRTPDPSERVGLLQTLLQKVEPIPADWIPGRGEGASHGRPHLEPVKCESWKRLRNSWRNAMKWNSDLEHMLLTCLASIISTETVGDSQLWVMVMAPPSSGKTTICEALGVARDFIYQKSVLNKIHSGYKEDKEGSKDFGDVPLLRNRTLIVKDGDTLLEDPNRGVILSQYRDLFDGAARVKYGHGLAFNHENVKFTMILCGTAKMREIDAAEAGTRFISCCFSEVQSPDRDREVSRMVFHRAMRNVRTIANGEPESRIDPDMAQAKKLTGGYIIYLRRNAERLLGQVEIPDWVEDRILDFGFFVSYFRARSPKRQDEVVEREAPHRLVEQFGRLAVCLSAVENKIVIDASTVRRVHQIALDSSRGRTLDLVKVLYRGGPEGRVVGALSMEFGEPEDKVRSLLKFLNHIGVVELVPAEDIPPALRTGKRWRLTSDLVRLYQKVVEDYETPL